MFGLDYGDIKFPVPERDYKKIKKNNNICINQLVMKWFDLSVHVSNEKCLY